VAAVRLRQSRLPLDNRAYPAQRRSRCGDNRRQNFVGAVADKMPMWDEDAISRYERVQIATVKADIAMARQTAEKEPFLVYVSKLHKDWDALVAWDEMLKKESLT
jgi:hypothetical protein